MTEYAKIRLQQAMYYEYLVCYYARHDGEAPMTETDQQKLIREYAAGEITWSALRRRGLTITSTC